MFSGKDHAAAPGTALTFLGFDRPGVDVDKGRLFSIIDGVALQESGATAESVALGTKFLGVAEFAVDVAVGTVASENRIQNTVTFVTVEARFVPHCSTGEHLLGSKDGSSASGTSLLTFCGFDAG